MSLARIGSYVGIIISPKWIAHVVRAWDVGSGPMAFVGLVFESTKHLSGMGPVSLVP
jgi:hypothetical protein